MPPAAVVAYRLPPAVDSVLWRVFFFNQLGELLAVLWIVLGDPTACCSFVSVCSRGRGEGLLCEINIYAAEVPYSLSVLWFGL